MAKAVRGLLLASGLVAFPAMANAACEARSPAHVVPLFELYTAEGCSDCPPADRWLSELAKETDPSRASMLAFHVDYWDEFGWTDPFSDPAFTQRQDFRIHLAKKKVRYTPQVMSGSETAVDWRDPAEVRRVMARAAGKPSPVALVLAVEKKEGGMEVSIHARPQARPAHGAQPDMLWLAMYQDGLVSSIGEGENKGMVLHHDHVARALLGPWALAAEPVDGSLHVPLPANADLSRYGLVVFAESSATGAGLQSLSLPLASCGW